MHTENVAVVGDILQCLVKTIAAFDPLSVVIQFSAPQVGGCLRCFVRQSLIFFFPPF